MAEKDRLGGVGNFRDLGKFDANRRMTPLPGVSNVPGLPGNNFSADKNVTPTPFDSKLGKGSKNRRPPSNIGRVARGEISSGIVQDKNTGTKFRINRDDLLADKTGKRKATGRNQGIGAQGPLVKEIADYARGMGANPGEIQGVSLQKEQQDPEFAGDPSKIKSKSTFYKDENAYGKINVMIRDQKRKITDKIALNKGKDRQVVKTAIDPKQVVETIDKDPNNIYNSERFEEKTLGKKMREATNEFKTPTIGKTALRQLYREGRATHVSEMTPDQIRGVGIDPAKVGTFAGVIDMGKIETSTTPLGNQQTKDLQRLIYEAKGSDGGVLKTKRTIPLNSRESGEVPEQLFRIGSPTAYDMDKVREAIAPFVGMEMKGEPKKGQRKSISLDQVKELQAKGFIFERTSDDGSTAVMTPPDAARRPENQINLTYEPRSKRFFLNREYETYEVGPTAFMTRPGTRQIQPRDGGPVRTGDIPETVRKTAEYIAPNDVVADFDDIIKESIKSDSAPPPPDVTAQGRKYIADQIVRSKELGYSNEQVQQLLDITPPGSAARKDLVNAVIERYQEVSPNARRREIDLFQEGMGDVDVGARRLREVLTEMKDQGKPASRTQLYQLADLIGKRIDVSGNDIINVAGKRDFEKPEFLATDIENQAKYGNGVNGYQLPKEELAIDQVGKDPIYTRGRGDITTNKPELMPRGVGNARMPYDLVGEVPLFASAIPAEAEAIRSMAQADPTRQAGAVETSKTSMLNAPPDQPMYGPIGRKPEEMVLQNRAYTDTVQVKNYAQMAKFLGREVGDPMQEKAMAALAQRIAARLRR